MIAIITKQMMLYEHGNVKAIEHFLKVYAYAKTIGKLEKLDASTQYILELAALLHDIGIQESMKVYQSKAGIHQEQLGPPIAKEMMEKVNIDQEMIARVCYLIQHHHTYHDIQGMDYQILVEADFLVNFAEGNVDLKTLSSVKDRIFKTKSGISMMEVLYE